MANHAQVMCIIKRDRKSRHERISHIGGVASGKAWRITEDQAITYIKNGEWQFFVSVPGGTAWVIIANHLGREYLKTQADTTLVDNLLSLPDCP